MNCEKYQSLISDFVDGALTPEDQQNVESHLGLCASCAEVRGDLDSIVTYCQDHRGE